MKNKLRNSRSCGSSIAEMGPAALVSIPILIAVFQIAMLVNGVKVNDAVAAEAVRVVAAGDPSSAPTRAQVIVDHANQQSTSYGSAFSLVAIDFAPTDIIAREAKLVPYGGTLTGTVAVTTQLSFRPLGVTGPVVTINGKKTCPFTYNVPNTAGGLPVVPQ